MTKFTIKDGEIVKIEYGVIEVFADTQPDDMVVYTNGEIKIITDEKEYTSILQAKNIERLKIQEEARISSNVMFEKIQEEARVALVKSEEAILTLDTTSEEVAIVVAPIDATLEKVIATKTKTKA